MNRSIAGADWLHAAPTRRAMAALEAVRADGSRFVGGCVRNALMGLAATDIDIATQLLPEETIAAAQAAGLGAHPTGIDHGTITIVADHQPFEVTTLRRDVSTDGRRATVAFTQDWMEDAQRRDFRMNALYADSAGRVFDPTQGGVEDAQAGRVIFVGDPDTRIREDYLRILRFFRFNAWYGKGALDAAGLAACARHLTGLDGLSVERIWQETKKLFAAADPRRALEAMIETGVAARALPELEALARVRRLIEIEADAFLPFDGLQRIAAGVADADRARALSRRLKVSNEEKERLTRAHGEAPRVVSYLSVREIHRALYLLGAEAFRDRVKIAWAGDEKTSASVQWRALLTHADVWPIPKFPLTGDEAMAAGLPAGPKVGQALREVEAWWIDADFPDDRLALIERLKAVVQGLL
ncbi:MAG: CCA tRNA nucleotidyltransferase [Hyphomonadaceae bacterium]